MAPTERPRRSTGLIHHTPRPTALAAEDHAGIHTWAAHVASGRIGDPAPMHPDALASIARMEAILRAGRQGAMR